MIASLSRYGEGVEFRFEWDGESIRAVVFRDLLEGSFGATDSPTTWLAAYAQHRVEIKEAAVKELLTRPRPRLGMVVLKGRFGDDAEGTLKRI